MQKTIYAAFVCLAFFMAARSSPCLAKSCSSLTESRDKLFHKFEQCFEALAPTNPAKQSSCFSELKKFVDVAREAENCLRSTNPEPKEFEVKGRSSACSHCPEWIEKTRSERGAVINCALAWLNQRPEAIKDLNNCESGLDNYLRALKSVQQAGSARFVWKSKPFIRFHLHCTYLAGTSNFKDKHFSVKAYAESEDGPLIEAVVKLYTAQASDKKKQKMITGPYYLGFVKPADNSKIGLEFSDPKGGIKFVFHGGEKQESGKADFSEKDQRSELDCKSTKFLFPE